jgi:hypothetical protein
MSTGISRFHAPIVHNEREKSYFSIIIANAKLTVSFQLFPILFLSSKTSFAADKPLSAAGNPA